MPENPLPTAPLPPVQRLSRAVLLVAAGLVSLTLLTVAFLATPKSAGTAGVGDRGDRGDRGNRGDPGDRGDRSGSTSPDGRPMTTSGIDVGPPGFLQHPVRAPEPAPPEIAEQEYLRRLAQSLPNPPAGQAAPGWAGASAPAASGAPFTSEGSDAAGASGAPGAAGASGAAGAAGAAGGFDPAAAALLDGRRDQRDAFLRALRAPLSPSSSHASPPANPSLPNKTENAAPNAPGGQNSSPGVVPPAALAAATVPAPLLGAAVPVVPAGTVVSALLLTAVNSDLPGPLLAQVSRDVYDLRQRNAVLPRGTRLFGRYENQIAVGQQRLLVAWTRLQLLDGTMLSVPGLSAADPSGAAGLPARVDNHVLRVFGDAVLLSLLGAGADLSQPAAASSLSAPAAGSVASAALGQQLAEAGTQLLRRDLAIQPTLSLPAGTPLTIFVNADLPLPVHPAAPPLERR